MKITDDMIRANGINIGGNTIMPVANVRPISALQKLSRTIRIPKLLTLPATVYSAASHS
jgi:hypothetical protein